MLCMAVLVHKSEKKTVPQPTTVFIETVPTVDDYFSIPIVTFVPPTSPPPPTGYLPSMLSFFVLALSVIGNEVLSTVLQLALRNVLLPLLRIAKRWSVASIKSAWRRVHGWTSRGRVTGADASSNINESSSVQDAVQKAREAERAAAKQHEKRLVDQRDAANKRASNAISQSSYDSLRKSFDTLRDQLNDAQDAKKAAIDELQAERANDSLKKSFDTLREQFKEAKDAKQAAIDELQAERAKTEALVQQEAENTAKSLEQAAQARDEAVQDAETRAEEAKTKAQELKEKLQRTEEALEKASSKEEGPSNEDIYDTGYQAAVRDCEAKAETVITERVNAAVANGNVEMLGQFNLEVENAVVGAKEPLEAQLNSANERATAAEAALEEAKSSLETVQQKAADEWQRASDAHKAAVDEYARAEKAEDEVRKYKSGKASQDQRIRGYLDDISRLKKLIPKNAALSLKEIESVTRDRQRAQALIEEFTVRAYDWETKQVLKKLLEANEKIIELECLLKDPRTQSNQIDFLKVLLNAEVNPDQYMSLNLPMRQVIVKQCRAVNARLNDLKTLINASQRPRKEALLF